MTTRLAANGIVCLPGVGFLGSKFVAVDFLGAPRCFPTGPASLARASDAVLLPFFNFVAADGTERIVIEEPLPVTASGDDGVVECVTRYARLLERYVRRYPEQWPRWHDSPVASVAECRGHVLSAGRRSPSWRAGPDRSPSS